MKELSIEEKARRYDEAIERAKRAHNSAKSDKENGVTDKITGYTIQLIETIFPELAEPEDEKIRNIILDQMKHWHQEAIKENCDIDIEVSSKCVAWLEKQSKALTVEEAMRDVEQKAKAFTKANEGLTSDEILAQMRSEGWCENESEDERIRNEIITFIVTTPKERNNHQKWIAWLEKHGEQKPTEWTSEDEEELKIALNTLEKAGQYSSAKWLKNVCLVPQTMQKPAWSEEDENGLGDALWAIQQARTIAKDENDMGNLWYAEHWLKSLKDRYTWKPSDEIMKGLNEIINKLAISPVIHEHGYLYDLMVNLRKKLKG